MWTTADHGPLHRGLDGGYTRSLSDLSCFILRTSRGSARGDPNNCHTFERLKTERDLYPGLSPSLSPGPPLWVTSEQRVAPGSGEVYHGG